MALVLPLVFEAVAVLGEALGEGAAALAIDAGPEVAGEVATAEARQAAITEAESSGQSFFGRIFGTNPTAQMTRENARGIFDSLDEETQGAIGRTYQEGLRVINDHASATALRVIDA